MKLALAFAVGVIVGVLGAWEAGRRFERWAFAWSLAAERLRVARLYAGDAAGWVIGVGLVLLAGGALAWIAF
ncbi:hypothetical protein GCM10027280_45160 [Micromonospora polyrhachis]|uniref:Uncharacterized protein n=1 Tax=Micromonospora polyrhachis TaxID=1282883 RepID=A0A7W7WPI3_9ACTN|nr:hypothetical protein [Micromonospora polyrhachis]MBB4958970.1 hypothetical protein [Micromonospora polyrhachis]